MVVFKSTVNPKLEYNVTLSDGLYSLSVHSESFEFDGSFKPVKSLPEALQAFEEAAGRFTSVDDLEFEACCCQVGSDPDEFEIRKENTLLSAVMGGESARRLYAFVMESSVSEDMFVKRMEEWSSVSVDEPVPVAVFSTGDYRGSPLSVSVLFDGDGFDVESIFPDNTETERFDRTDVSQMSDYVSKTLSRLQEIKSLTSSHVAEIPH